MYQISKKFLIEEYSLKNRSAHNIAKEIGCSENVIHRRLKKYNISMHTQCSGLYARPEIYDYDYLYKEYIVNKLSKKQIAINLNCSHSRVRNQLKKFNITRNVHYNQRTIKLLSNIKNNGFVLLEEYISSRQTIKIQCHCGQIFYSKPYRLGNGHTKSCGCIRSSTLSKHYKGYKDISQTIYSGYIRGAKSRNIEFNLSKKDIWDQYCRQNQKCALTGLPINWGRNKKEKTASLDRIDSNLGYIISNIQIVHKDINKMKNCFNQEYFIKMCRLCIENTK